MALEVHGLDLMPTKCSALSLAASGREKKVKVITEPQFRTKSGEIPQLKVKQNWKYLGILFAPEGCKYSKVDILQTLGIIKRAPLKPQQRVHLIKNYVLPRYTHGLVLGGTTYGQIRMLDKQVRRAVREWLKLPNDIPKGFFHAPVKEGGLGIPSLESQIPELTLRRLLNLTRSEYPLAKAVSHSRWAEKRRRWCGISKLKTKDWTTKLHSSADGWELREVRKSTLSSDWQNDPMAGIPARDWIQHVRTRINALPSAMRTSRGSDRRTTPPLCRAGCNKPETTAHIIQECHRTHGGRILRHDAIATKVAHELTRCGYETGREQIFDTPQGRRKPDIIAKRGRKGYVIDVQIVSAGKPLAYSHKSKRDYYAKNVPLIKSVSDSLQVPMKEIEVSTVTISWRGVWADEPDRFISKLGVRRSALRSVSTRVLQGSHTNFTRWNQMTTMAPIRRTGTRP